MFFQFKVFKKSTALRKLSCGSGVLLWLAANVIFCAGQTIDSSMIKPTPSPSVAIQTPALPGTANQTDVTKPITLKDAIDLSLQQASAFKAAQLNTQIAAEDVRQARAAFYPKIVAAPTVIYTTPSLAKTDAVVVQNGQPAVEATRPFSFIGANAISEFQALVNTSGEIDTSGKLKATLKRNQALLESARLGGEIARRDLITAVQDAYFNLALSTLKRRGAETNLKAAQDFENYQKLQLDAGEIAPVDLTRARLQSSTRSDELEQAKNTEAVSADALRVLIGYDFATPVATEDLLLQMPQDNEIESYAQTAIKTRPEFAQFEADRLAAEQDINVAKAERRPQITYSVGSGFVSDSLRPNRIYDTLGVQATVGVTIPLFDKGASRSRAAQAKLKLQQAENNRQLAERQFAQEFFTSRAQAISARTRIRQLAASITDAESNVSASLARYRAGEAPITEVTDANNTLVTQRQALYQAIFDYNSARAKLLRAIGQ